CDRACQHHLHCRAGRAQSSGPGCAADRQCAAGGCPAQPRRARASAYHCGAGQQRDAGAGRTDPRHRCFHAVPQAQAAWPVKLRSRLFLSNGALLTVALIGLLLGIFSVLHLTRAQSQAMTSTLGSIEAATGLSQELNRQLALLLVDEPDLTAIRTADARFEEWLAEARKEARHETEHQTRTELTEAYAVFENLLAEPLTVRQQILGSDEFSRHFSTIHNHIDRMLMHYLVELRAGE